VIGCPSIQLPRRNRRRGRLRLLQHLQCRIEAIAQIGGGVGAAAQAAGGDEFDLRRSIRLRHQNAGRQLDLDRTVHGAVGADDVEIDQRGCGPGVLVNQIGRLGGRLANGFLRDRAQG
jgi:hypothetical protein